MQKSEDKLETVDYSLSNTAYLEEILKETAYHEAGHFMACALIGLYPGAMSIEPEGDTLGSVGRMGEYSLNVKDYMSLAKVDPITGQFILDEEIWKRAIRSAQTNAFLCVAGTVAGQLYIDAVNSDLLEASGGEDDEESALEGLEAVKVYPDPWERYKEIERVTYHIFYDPTVWRALEYTAQTLLKDRTLDQDAVGDLYGEVLDMIKGKGSPPHFENLELKYPLPRKTRFLSRTCQFFAVRVMPMPRKPPFAVQNTNHGNNLRSA